MTDDRDFTSYVAARWTPLVRSLIALGAPLSAAHRGAAETLSRCHDAWDERDEWIDLDVHVFQDLVSRWDRRRDAWWELAARDAEVDASTGWPEVEAALDRIDVADRRALVLHEVAGLSPEQAQDVAGTNVARTDPVLVGDLHEAVEMLPVDQPPIEEMIEASRRRSRRRRGLSVAGGVALVAVAGVVTALVLRHGDPPADQPPPESFSSVRTLAYDNPSPVAWYADGRLYLPHSQTDLRDVREFGQWNDGAVYLDVRGNLVTVTGEGVRARIVALGPEATFAVSDADDRVVWVDPSGPELVVYDLNTGERVLEQPLEQDDSRLVSLVDGDAYVTSGEEMLAVDLADGSIDVVVDRRLPGELDRDGQFVLTREGGGAATARVRLYDTATGRPIALRVDHPGSVTAARFGPNGSVLLLVEPPGATIGEMRRCPPPYQKCHLVAFFSTGGARSLLAS